MLLLQLLMIQPDTFTKILRSLCVQFDFPSYSEVFYVQAQGTRQRVLSSNFIAQNFPRIIFSQPPGFSHTRFSIRLLFSFFWGSSAVESIQPAAFVNRCTTTIQPQGMGAKSAVPKKLSKAVAGAAQMEWKTFVT